MVATIRFLAEVANNLAPGGDGSQLSQALDIACRQGYQGRQASTLLKPVRMSDLFPLMEVEGNGILLKISHDLDSLYEGVSICHASQTSLPSTPLTTYIR